VIAFWSHHVGVVVGAGCIRYGGAKDYWLHRHLVDCEKVLIDSLHGVNISCHRFGQSKWCTRWKDAIAVLLQACQKFVDIIERCNVILQIAASAPGRPAVLAGVNL